jgi:N,N'-diacetyllegionaminate synthase
VALVQPTTPLCTPEDLHAAILPFLTGGAASVATVSPAPHALWSFLIDDGRLQPLAKDAASVTRRQDAPETYALNGAAFVTATDALAATRLFVEPGRTLASVMPAERGIDVDSEADLAQCEALLAASQPAGFALAQRRIGPEAPCFVIAELGVNHNGDLQLAHRLLDAAADAAADAVKLQTFDPELLAASSAPLAEYQARSGEAAGDQLGMLRRLALSQSAHAELKAHAEARGVVFLSSPFDERSADFLEALGVAAFKVPSGEAVNHAFLAHLARKGRPLLVSTGMCDMVEVAGAVDAIRASGNPPLALLHCVSNYPAEPAEANLRVLRTLREAFAVPVGWSDHTRVEEVSVAAVALGASLVERHLTLDRRMPGPDHAASLEPAAFAGMVKAIRSVEQSLGSPDKRPVAAEAAIAAVARKSLHWRVPMGAGSRVRESDLVALRPGTGISPSRLMDVVGRRLRRDVSAGSMVAEQDLVNEP